MRSSDIKQQNKRTRSSASKSRTSSRSKAREKSAMEKVKDFPMRREDYFHNKMNRYDAQDKLQKVGDWLLRQDRGRKMMVSVRKGTRSWDHVEVGYDEKKKVFNFAKNGSTKKIVYRDFDALVESI